MGPRPRLAARRARPPRGAVGRCRRTRAGLLVEPHRLRAARRVPGRLDRSPRRPSASVLMSDRAGISKLIERVCAERELPCEPTGEHSYAVTLPGQHKLKTVCNLIVGEHALRIEAFVMRHPDEHREELWEWLLQRNARMYGVAFCVDKAGDVYLVGRHSLHAVTEEELDRLLGAVLTYADESFGSMLE